MQHDAGMAPRHCPVVRLVEVIVEPDDGARLSLAAVCLDHLTPKREPTSPVGLDEPASLVAMAVRVDDQDVLDDVRLVDRRHPLSVQSLARLGRPRGNSGGLPQRGRAVSRPVSRPLGRPASRLPHWPTRPQLPRNRWTAGKNSAASWNKKAWPASG